MFKACERFFSKTGSWEPALLDKRAIQAVIRDAATALR
jgi:hypothetical protein